MSERSIWGGLVRRRFLAGTLALPAAAGLQISARTARAAPDEPGSGEKLGIPGPYPGRVVEVRNSAMIRGGVKNRTAIAASLRRGMCELTGADDVTSAWRRF